MQEQPNSRLMRLPAELRNRIHELSLPRTITIPSDRPEDHMVLTKLRAPGLLLTSKQIHREAIGLYYTFTSFWFLVPSLFTQWARSISRKNLQVVREIVLVIAADADESQDYMVSVVTVSTEGYEMHLKVQDPVAALKRAGTCAQGIIDRATAHVGVARGVVNVAMQVRPQRREKWWTEEPEKLVEEVIAEADEKTMREIGEMMAEEDYSLPDDA